MGTVTETLKSIVNTNHIEIYATAAIGLAYAMQKSIRYELREAQRMPLAYSEIRQIQKDAQAEQREVGDITMFLTSVNDLCMKVFECNNKSYGPKYKSSIKGFAEELSANRSITRNGNSLKGLFSNSTRYSDKLKSTLKDHAAVVAHLRKINRALGKAWSEDHDHHYRTEIYPATVTYSDAKGNIKTKIVMKTRQVYDYSIHQYWFVKRLGDDASTGYKTMYKAVTQLLLKEKIVPTSKVSDEGKETARKSRSSKVEFSDEDALTNSAMWFEGTLNDDDLEAVIGIYSKLKNKSKRWHDAKETAQAHYRKRTNSKSHSGPPEYRVAKSALNLGKDICDKIGGFIADMEMINERIPALQNDIEQYLYFVKYDNAYVVQGQEKQSKKKARKLKKKILEDTKEIYNEVFTQGIDTDLIKEWRVILWSLAGAASGGGVGALAEFLSNKFQVY